MHIKTPLPIVRDGEFIVHANHGGPAGHFAIVQMGDHWDIGLDLHDVADCDRIINAAATAKRMLEAISAGTAHEFDPGAGPHGSHCRACGLLAGFEAHADPAAPAAAA